MEMGFLLEVTLRLLKWSLFKGH